MVGGPRGQGRLKVVLCCCAQLLCRGMGRRGQGWRAALGGSVRAWSRWQAEGWAGRGGAPGHRPRPASSRSLACLPCSLWHVQQGCPACRQGTFTLHARCLPHLPVTASTAQRNGERFAPRQPPQHSAGRWGRNRQDHCAVQGEGKSRQRRFSKQTEPAGAADAPSRLQGGSWHCVPVARPGSTGCPQASRVPQRLLLVPLLCPCFCRWCAPRSRPRGPPLPPPPRQSLAWG